MKTKRYLLAITLTTILLLAGCSQSQGGEPDASTFTDSTPIITWNSATVLAITTKDTTPPAPEPSPTPSPSPSIGTAAGAEETVMYVSLEHYGSTLTVRTEPSAKSKAAGTLNHRDEVTVLNISGGWARIMNDGLERYVKADYLVKSRPPALDKPKATPGKPKIPLNFKSPVIKVYKSRRVLELWDGKKRIDTFPIALGWEPSGHKQREGDGRTPEGVYYLCTRNAASSYYKSLGVSYPGKKDADEAYESELITAGQRDAIHEAINSRQRPPWDTALGGEIMIHGGGSENDWTAGCIAVEDEVIDILWDACGMGTKVFIYP